MIISLDKAIEILKAGGNVAMPTETVYGLAGRYDSIKAIENIFRIKQRPSFDPLICHVSNMDMVSELAEQMDPISLQLAKDFWPGPLTIVVKKSVKVDSSITAGLDTVAIRMPSHPIALDMIEQVGSPLCAPSANYFGKTSPSTAKHVVEEFQGEIAVVDGGDCEIGIESSIVEVIEGKVVILRKGMIHSEDLSKKGYDVIDISIGQKSHGPGMMQDHYMPRVPFYLVGEDKKHLLEKRESLSEWQLETDPYKAARNLYKNLREQANTTSGFYAVYNESEDEVWGAIWDRLKKASYRKDLF